MDDERESLRAEFERVLRWLMDRDGVQVSVEEPPEALAAAYADQAKVADRELVEALEGFEPHTREWLLGGLPESVLRSPYLRHGVDAVMGMPQSRDSLAAVGQLVVGMERLVADLGLAPRGVGFVGDLNALASGGDATAIGGHFEYPVSRASRDQAIAREFLRGRGAYVESQQGQFAAFVAELGRRIGEQPVNAETVEAAYVEWDAECQGAG